MCNYVHVNKHPTLTTYTAKSPAARYISKKAVRCIIRMQYKLFPWRSFYNFSPASSLFHLVIDDFINCRIEFYVNFHCRRIRLVLLLVSLFTATATAILVGGGGGHLRRDRKPVYEKDLGKPLILTDFIKSGKLKQGFRSTRARRL